MSFVDIDGESRYRLSMTDNLKNFMTFITYSEIVVEIPEDTWIPDR